MHSEGFHIIDNVVAADETVVNKTSSSFFVVSATMANRKLRKVYAAAYVKAVGSAEIQVKLLRSGAESNLLSTPFSYNTSAFFGNTINVLDVTLVEGDIIFTKILNVSGTAKGLSVSLDIR